MATLRLTTLAMVVSMAACGGLDVDSRGSQVVIEGSPEATGILRFLNGPDASFELLDIDVGLDVRAARNITDHVRGADGILGSADDDLLDTLAELDDIKYVGPSAIDKLYAYVDSIGGIPELVVEGVLLTPAEVEAIMTVANGASQSQLDDDAALDSRAAANIVAARPLADIDALAAVPWVGGSAIGKLRDYAPNWSAPEPPPPPPSEEGCDVEVLPRADADAEAWDELLAVATTGDWPYAEMIAAQASPCTNLYDSAQRDALVEVLAPYAGIDWGYDHVYPYAEELFKGAAPYLSLMAISRQAIEEHVADGQWDPAEAPELWAARDQIYDSLTAAAAAAPNAFYELTMTIDAEECSQKAVALVDPATNRIWIIHRYPLC